MPKKNQKTAPLKVGDTHGYLRVLAETSERQHRHKLYLVECACGRRIKQPKFRFVRSESCGCASSPTFQATTFERFLVARGYLRESKNKFSSSGLARLLVREYPRLYKSFDSAYSVIRQIRGVNGNSTRNETEFLR